MIPAPPPPLIVGPLTRTDLVRYQGASGDMQPVHHDEEFVRAAGYDRPLSLGMLHAGLLGTWAASWLGAESVRRFRVRFTAQAFPGDTLTCTGAVVEERPAEVDVELSCTTQEDVVVARAWATFAVEEPS